MNKVLITDPFITRLINQFVYSAHPLPIALFSFP